MSNISVRKRDGEHLSAAIESLGPLRVMQRLLGWDPFREMAALAPAEEAAAFAFAPAFEVKEKRDAYEFRADLPGVADTDIEITITGNRLTISGKREAEAAEPNDTYFASERAYGSFVRSFTLPDGADPERITATLANGVLVVTVPKKQETQAKKIAVTSSQTSQGAQQQGQSSQQQGQSSQQQGQRSQQQGQSSQQQGQSSQQQGQQTPTRPR